MSQQVMKRSGKQTDEEVVIIVKEPDLDIAKEAPDSILSNANGISEELIETQNDEAINDNTANITTPTESLETHSTSKIEEKEEEFKEPIVSIPLDQQDKEEEEETLSELQFDENDVEVESEGSPNRCRTRLSQTRNICTPKTPKSNEQQDVEFKGFSKSETCVENNSGTSTPKKIISSTDGNTETQAGENVDLNDTSDTYSSVSTDNVSTRAVAGSDATRNTDFTCQDSQQFEEFTYPFSPNCSLADTLRNLSSRPTIRPILNEEYKKITSRRTFDNKDLYTEYEGIERISVGTKRKQHNLSPENTKRLKKDETRLFSYFSNPLMNIKNAFYKPSSPQLVGYKNKIMGTENDGELTKISLEDDSNEESRKKCSIM